MNESKDSHHLHPEKLPFRKAVQWILLSIVFITGSSALSILYYKHVREKQKMDPANTIVALVQTSPDAEGLRTVYLAELLNLSIDRPTNLYAFNSKEAGQKLLSSPVIKEASVRKIRPGTVHVDYTLRQPIAFLADYTNTALDAEGTVFPFKPFFTPKKLPEIYLGNDETGEESTATSTGLIWGMPLQGRRIELAFNILGLAQQFCDASESLTRIDVSKAFALSYGQRQIVLVIEDRIPRLVDGNALIAVQSRILRLAPDNYLQQLANYTELRSYLRKQNRESEKDTVIDLRLSELAFFMAEQ